MISNLSRLAQNFEPPAWLDTDEVEEDISIFPELRALGIYGVAGTLGTVGRMGRLPKSISRLFEFGSSYGEGLVALDMLARTKDGAEVTGSEIEPDSLYIARQVANILPSVTGVEQNGIHALTANVRGFDVILANMFGPSYNDESAPAMFIPPALVALSEGGVIILNSDPKTMKNVGSWVQRNLRPGQAEAIDSDLLPMGLRVATPHMIITK